MTRCSAAYCWIKSNPEAAFECMGIGSKRRQREALVYIQALEDVGAIFDKGHEDSIKEAIKEIGTQTHWLKVYRKSIQGTKVTHDQKESSVEVPLQELGAFPIDDLQKGIDDLLKMLEDWRKRCREKDLDKLETRLVEFYVKVRNLREDLHLTSDGVGIGL